MSIRQKIRVLWLFLVVSPVLTPSQASAQDHFLQLRIVNIRGEGIPGVVLAPTDVRGDPSSISDTGTGYLRIKLKDTVKANTTITLTVVNPKHRYVFLSPPNGRVPIPTFDSPIIQQVILIVAGERGILSDGGVMLIVTTAVLQLGDDSVASAHKKEPISRDQAIENLAEALGLQSRDVEGAINSWIIQKDGGQRQKAIAAQYDKHYEDASRLFAASLENGFSKDQKNPYAYDDARFLGDSLYKQHLYKNAVGAYEQALKAKPSDPAVLYSLGVASLAAGDVQKAEKAFRSVTALEDPDYPDIDDFRLEAAESLDAIFERQGRFEEALAILKDANEWSFDAEYPENNTEYLGTIIELLVKHPIDDHALVRAYEEWIDRLDRANERPEFDNYSARKLIQLYLKMHRFSDAIGFLQSHSDAYGEDYVKKRTLRIQAMQKQFEQQQSHFK
jgi:tetratricopeptide (TPR) repeat protein